MDLSEVSVLPAGLEVVYRPLASPISEFLFVEAVIFVRVSNLDFCCVNQG